MRSSWLHESRREWAVAIAIVMITLGVIGFVRYPIYYEFYAPGEMVSLQDIGIQSSAHMVWIYNGTTDNPIEKWYMRMFIGDKDIEFTRIGSYYAEFNEDLDELSQYRVDTVVHAFNAVITESNSDLVSGLTNERLDQVLADTSNYYGDSLGLMVAVGLMEESEQADYSQSGQYIIAGTGTIEEDFSVGAIGGIEQKLIVAERAHVTHFFIPKDEEWNGEWSNEVEARNVVAERGLTMQVIPVSTLDEAIQVLKTLP
ncbi:MAG: S16 family serine protease [Paenibacillaceae bacterium]